MSLNFYWLMCFVVWDSAHFVCYVGDNGFLKSLCYALQQSHRVKAKLWSICQFLFAAQGTRLWGSRREICYQQGCHFCL